MYTPAGGGRLLFVKENVLFAQALSADGRQLRGEPGVVARGVASNPRYNRSEFSVSGNGVVVWRPGTTSGVQLTSFDRVGQVVGTTGGLGNGPLSVRLAPGDRHLLVSENTQQWLSEAGQPGRVVVGRRREWVTAIWSHDGNRLLLPGNGKLFEVAVSDAGIRDEREIGATPGPNRLEDLSSDGTVVLFNPGAPTTRILALPLAGPAAARIPTTVLEMSEGVYNARFSPDGRWIVFAVPASAGQPGGIFVRPFPGTGLRTQIATSGSYPTWRGDGKEIVFLDKGKVWSIGVDQRRAIPFARPEPLFDVGPHSGVADISVLAVSSDGSRIYLPQFVAQPGSDMIHVRIGWLKP
jgi:hypothetical protein